MRKKSISITMGILAVFGAMNLMCFILKATTISRITCNTFQEAMAQNSLHIWAMLVSLIGIGILSYYQKRLMQISDEADIENYKRQTQE